MQARKPLCPEVIQSIKKLTLASEYLYIDIHALFPLLTARGEFDLFADLVYTIFPFGYEYAAIFISLYSRLSFPLKAIDTALRAFVLNTGNRVKKAGCVIEYALLCRDPATVSFLLEQFSFVGYWSPGSLLEVFEIAKKNMAAYPYPVFEKWILRGTDLLTSNRLMMGSPSSSCGPKRAGGCSAFTRWCSMTLKIS